jgi:hypothetical protein
MPTRFILIIGAMKSGTTSLFHHLSRHRAICPSRVKEVKFFSSPDCWELGTGWYAECFDYDPRVHLYAMEASTDYTKRPYLNGVVPRLQLLEGVDYRFIYIMRNPLRRIESHVRHLDRTKREIGRDVLTDQRISLDAGISDVWIDLSRYAYQLQPYVDAFGPERIHLTTLEQLQADPLRVMSEIFAFLGLEPCDVDAREAVNQAFDGRSPVAAWTAASRIGWLNRAYLRAVPKAVRAKLRELVSVRSSGFGRYKLTREEERSVVERLRDDLRALSKTYGVDVEGLWGISLDPGLIPVGPTRKQGPNPLG